MAVDYTIDVPAPGASRGTGKTEVARLQDISDTIADINTRIAAYEANGLNDADIGVTVQAYDADLDALAAIAGVEGDILYRNATTWTRLPKGTAGQVLTVNAGATAPEWAAASGGGGGSGTFSGAIVSRSTTQSIPTTTFTAVLFTTETVDTDAYHDGATNTDRLTAPSTGYYLVVGEVTIAPGTEADTHRYADITKNGTRVAIASAPPWSESGFSSAINLSAIVSLTAGDYVNVRAFQDTGVALNVETAHAEIVRLG